MDGIGEHGREFAGLMSGAVIGVVSFSGLAGMRVEALVWAIGGASLLLALVLGWLLLKILSAWVGGVFIGLIAGIIGGGGGMFLVLLLLNLLGPVFGWLGVALVGGGLVYLHRWVGWG